ncbi:hypothetical protein DUNSADRAFT_8631 [Dunaliella salina]|uniref:Uncharacterized protein n=1 Tax=Dunaliella salina TaxID=3046 RepID=A0ABQ7H5Y7_DUNSA|nr:hypothetical protein DUNSADRAFT_8631 [Dunaliella salina]|eukprot:KAF5842231.1 hypothetical protein DUNSADRAFT_8631 [Dunaliella salina]
MLFDQSAHLLRMLLLHQRWVVEGSVIGFSGPRQRQPSSAQDGLCKLVACLLKAVHWEGRSLKS